MNNKRKIWIAVGVTAVALVVGARYFNYPPNLDMSGTVAPAQRSVAKQPGDDVTVAGQGNEQPTPVAGADDAGRDAAKAGNSDGGIAKRPVSTDGSRDAAGNSDGLIARPPVSTDGSRDAAGNSDGLIARPPVSTDGSRDAH